MVEDWEPDCKLAEVARTPHYLVALVRPAKPPADVLNALGSERVKRRVHQKLLGDIEAQMEGYWMHVHSPGRSNPRYEARLCKQCAELVESVIGAGV